MVAEASEVGLRVVFVRELDAFVVDGVVGDLDDGLASCELDEDGNDEEEDGFA